MTALDLKQRRCQDGNTTRHPETTTDDRSQAIRWQTLEPFHASCKANETFSRKCRDRVACGAKSSSLYARRSLTSTDSKASAITYKGPRA
jgi:hypothetical protein